MRRPDQEPKPRRGSTLPALLWALFVAGTVVTTAVIVTPRYLRAEPAPPSVPARVAVHQQVFEAFTALISRSKEVVAVNQRGATPFLELVLWLEDTEHLGFIDSDEIAVISHSEVLQTISMHVLAPTGEKGEVPGDAGPDDMTKALKRSDIRDGRFCARFREHPDVTRRLLASGIAHLDAEPLLDAAAGRTMLRISFIWAADSTDGRDEASALKDVFMRTDDDA